LGIDLFSIGQIEPASPADQVVEGGQDGSYACFLFREDRLVGAILLGDAGPAARVKQLVEEKQPCEALLRPGMGAAQILAELCN
jgi:nitrite reductase (NADH) large subunit